MEILIVVVMKFGVVGVVGIVQGGGGGGGGGSEEVKVEKIVFEIKFEGFEVLGKIKIIKEVRSFIDLGFKEVKELVEKIFLVLKVGVLKEEGEKIVEKFKVFGVKVVFE